MSSNLTDTTPARRAAVNDTQSAKRRKTSKFVEYQPSNGTLKKVPYGKKPNSEPRKNLSCAECRRLKLKCDRVFPCRACVRRGCQGICPDGSLVSGKGTRYVLASTEKLHEKISAMSDRILELEDALRALYEEHRICLSRSQECRDSDEHLPPTHPLLVGDKLLVKNHFDLYGEEQEQESPASSQPPARNDDQVYGDSVQEIRENGEDGISSLESDRDTRASQTPVDGQDLLEKRVRVASSPAMSALAALFWPLWRKRAQGLSISAEINDAQLEDSGIQLLRSELLGALPPHEEAERLSAVTREAGFFVLNYVLTKSDVAEIIRSVYDRRAEDISMANLALLLLLIGVGLHTDYSSLGTKYDIEIDETAERYVSMSRAAMALHAAEQSLGYSSGLELRTIQYHFLLMHVLVLLCLRGQESRKKTDPFDVLVSLVKHDNLHMEESYSKRSEKEQDDRRILLYEILNIVGETCLAQDLPMPLSFVDVVPPSTDRKDTNRFPSEVEGEYCNRRRDFYLNCLKPVIDMRSIPFSDLIYSDILELDCKIRTFPFPPSILQGYDVEPEDTSGARISMWKLKLLRFINTYRVNTLLLHLHRRFMQQCLTTKGSILAHPYFASVVASCHSAWILIRNTDAVHQAFPELVNRSGLPWYNVLCAATANYILVERVPYCPLAPYCLRELNRAADVIESVSTTRSEIAARAAPIVRQFVTRAPRALQRWKEALDEVLESNTRLHSRADFCSARFDAMIKRIKQAGLPSSESSGITSPPHKDDPITGGLEIWDIAHPELGEVLTMLPGCVIDQRISDEALWETVNTPLDKDNTCNNRTRTSKTQTPLMEFFDTLDNRLRRRSDLMTSALSNEPTSDTSEGTGALWDMFPDNIELDWATLTDALVSAPQQPLHDMPNGGWTDQWDWRDSSISTDRGRSAVA